MKRVKLMIELDEDVVDKVKEWMKLEGDYAKLVQTAVEVVEEMFYLDNGSRRAIDLREKVKVTAL